MDRRFSLAATERRFATHILEQRNGVSPRIDYEAPSEDVLNFETELVQAKMRNMTPEEAAAFSAQAVAEAEAAMIEAADAMREAEAAEAEAEAAVAEAEAAAAAFKKMKARKKRRLEEPGTRDSQLEERSSD